MIAVAHVRALSQADLSPARSGAELPALSVSLRTPAGVRVSYFDGSFVAVALDRCGVCVCVCMCVCVYM